MYHRSLMSVLLLLCCVCLNLAHGWSYRTIYMDDHCAFTTSVVGDTAVQIKLTASSTYRPNMDCTMVIQTDISSRFLLKFYSVSIESSTSCRNDRLDLFDGPTTGSPRLTGLNGVCGFITPSTYWTTRGQYLTLRFTSDSSFQYSGFRLIVTKFRTSYSSFDDTTFDCGNLRYISNSLTCDGWNNCGNNHDELDGCGLTVGGIAGVVVAAIFCFVVLLTIAVICRRRRYRYVAVANSGGPTCTVTKTTYSPPAGGAYPSYQQPPPYGAAGQYQPAPPPAGAYPQ